MMESVVPDLYRNAVLQILQCVKVPSLPFISHAIHLQYRRKNKL